MIPMNPGRRSVWTSATHFCVDLCVLLRASLAAQTSCRGCVSSLSCAARERDLRAARGVMCLWSTDRARTEHGPSTCVEHSP